MGVVWREAGSWQPSCEANWTLGEHGELHGIVWGMGQLFFFRRRSRILKHPFGDVKFGLGGA